METPAQNSPPWITTESSNGNRWNCPISKHPRKQLPKSEATAVESVLNSIESLAFRPSPASVCAYYIQVEVSCSAPELGSIIVTVYKESWILYNNFLEYHIFRHLHRDWLVLISEPWEPSWGGILLLLVFGSLEGLLNPRLPAASLKDSVSSKDNLIETRTKIIVGAMPW